jgi:mannose-6-phosphate isomerase-like protein (cupin superfamily)
MQEHMERKKTMNVFKEAQKAWGSFDDFPVGQLGLDPMPHLSRSRVAQPFYLVTELDEVLIQMAGSAEVHFQDVKMDSMCLVPGDTVYLPAGVPTRIIPVGESVQVRLKGQPPLHEAVAWYCPQCGELVHSQEFVDAIPQRRYWQAVNAFNADERLRTCGACGAVHPSVELGDIAWPEVAAALEAEAAGAPA